MKTLTIGSRGSQLALLQGRQVADFLLAVYPHLDIQINSTHFNEGDHVKVTLIPSRPLYLYLFNWTAADGFTKLYQGRLTKKTQLPDDETYAFIARLEGAEESNEMLLTVAARSPLNFIASYSTEQLLKILLQHQRQGALINKINYKVIK